MIIWTFTKESIEDAITALVKQNECSENNRGCAYNNGEGLRCIIGHAMPDKVFAKYGDYMGSIGCLFNEFKIAGDVEVVNDTGLLSNEDLLRLLRRLQEVHDCTDPLYWKDAFKTEMDKFFP